ncbi:MAG: hypothetical protein P8P52_09665 [Opitutae bacterium]|nr:hypothetical protein [Opitutae bacterium]
MLFIVSSFPGERVNNRRHNERQTDNGQTTTYRQCVDGATAAPT